MKSTIQRAEEEIQKLTYELEYHEALLDYLLVHVPCLDVLIEDFELKGNEE